MGKQRSEFIKATESPFCDTCEHSINFHRFLKSAKPGACIAVFKTEKGEEYCKCNKFVPQK